jgi:hypothetical protein
VLQKESSIEATSTARASVVVNSAITSTLHLQGDTNVVGDGDGMRATQQQDWIANLTTSGGELGFIVTRAFVGNNNRIDMMQPYKKDYFSMFPWTWERDPCPPME